MKYLRLQGCYLGLQGCLLFSLWNTVLGQKTVDDYLNRCLDSKYQKVRPTMEDKLFGECSPWKDSSCCSYDVSKDLQTKAAWLGLSWDHCPGWSFPEKCRKHFLRDLCFYECSPNKGPWIEEVQMKVRTERFANLPLCESDCSAWWKDCKTAYTCLGRWDKGFDWTSGTNKCPAEKPCKPFTEIFNDAKSFCQNVWGGSWKVVPDTQPCFTMNFQNSNPNTGVARKRAVELLNGHNGQLNVKLEIYVLLGTLLIILAL